MSCRVERNTLLSATNNQPTDKPAAAEHAEASDKDDLGERDDLASETSAPRSGMGIAGSAPSVVPASRPANRTTPTLDSERFEQRAIIGRGGTSVVVRAFDKDILREVALKILAPESGEDGLEVGRFTEEARITGQLEHPNIVPVYEYGVDRLGQRFISMKLVEGKTLDDTLHGLQASRLDPEHLAELLKVFVKVCEAVSFAHSRGVIHRDLKPTNIMMSEFGQVYVLDWGIARRVRPSPWYDSSSKPKDLDVPGALIGTACYMAPEQLHGRHDALDARTDVFGLGATLYQVLTGEPPLTPDIVTALYLRKTPPRIKPPDQIAPSDRVPAELARIALQALSYDPAARYASVLDLKRDIELFQRGSWDLPRRAFAAGSILVTEGEPGNEAFVIVEGQCAAYRVEGTEEVTLRIMGPGEVFGETAVFSDKARSASVKALTDVVVLTVTSAALSSAVGLHSWMGAFVKALANRFRDVDDRLRSIEQSRRSSS